MPCHRLGAGLGTALRIPLRHAGRLRPWYSESMRTLPYLLLALGLLACGSSSKGSAPQETTPSLTGRGDGTEVTTEAMDGIEVEGSHPGGTAPYTVNWISIGPPQPVSTRASRNYRLVLGPLGDAP